MFLKSSDYVPWNTFIFCNPFPNTYLGVFPLHKIIVLQNEIGEICFHDQHYLSLLGAEYPSL